jgi:hypothetical protein
MATAGRKALSEQDKLNEIDKYKEDYLASISETKKLNWSTLTVEAKYKRILAYKRKLKQERILTPLFDDIKSGLKNYVETLTLNSYKSELLDIISIIDKKIESNKETDEKLAEINRKKKELEEEEKAIKSKQK